MLNEQELVTACISNDRIAQRKLYEAFAGKLLVVCNRYVQSEEEAEDILQDAFVKIFTSLNTFKFECPLSMWMRKIVVNTALNYLRSQKNIKFNEDIADHTNLPQIGEANSLDGIHFQELLGMIQELPNGCRVIFNMFIIEGYQHNEISDMLGVSIGTSKSQVSRARILLQEMIRKTEMINKLYAN